MATVTPTSFPDPRIIISNEAFSKSITAVPTIPNSSTPDGEYGEIVEYDFNPPEGTCSITITYVTSTAYQSYLSMVKTPGSVASITLDSGEVVVGKPTGVTRKGLAGTILYEVEIIVKLPQS